MGTKRMSQRDAEAGMWIAFEDFVIDGNLLSFTDHAGIDLQGVRAEQVWDIFLAHYKRDGRTIANVEWLGCLKEWAAISAALVLGIHRMKANYGTRWRGSICGPTDCVNGSAADVR